MRNIPFISKNQLSRQRAGTKIFHSGNLRLPISLLILFTLTGLTVTPAVGQEILGGSGFHIHNSMLGARSNALANTVVSDSYSLEGVYTNPAAYLFSEDNTTLTTNMFYNTRYNVMVENITGVILRNQEHLLVAGATMQHSGPEQYMPTTAQVPVSLNQFGLSLHYARKIGTALSFGTGISGTAGRSSDGSEDWALTTDFGLLYAPSPSVSYAIAYRGPGDLLNTLGNRLVYSYDDNSQDNGTQAAGLIVEPMPHQLEIGTTFRFPTISRTPSFKLSFANKKVFNKPGLLYKAGLELYPLDIIVLRGGYFYHPTVNGGRLGLGLLLGNFTLDYSYADNIIGLKGHVHQLGLSLRLSSFN